MFKAVNDIRIISTTSSYNKVNFQSKIKKKDKVVFDIQMIISIPGVHYTSSLNVHFLYCLQIHLLYTIQKDNCKKYVTLTMVSTWKSASTTESALYS